MEQTLGRKFWDGIGARAGRRGAMQRGGLVCAAGLALFRLCCPFSIGVVQGSSMTPTYRPGQFFLLDRNYYQNHPICRADVVVVQCDNHTMIKRVFGLAGDSIWLLIEPDGDRIERYIVDPQMLPRLRRAVAHWDFGRLTHLKVPSGTVYLLGDCSESSVDSRTFGAVPVSSIIGRVTPLRPGIGSVAARRAGT